MNEVISVSKLIQVLRERWKIIFIGTLLFVLIGVYINFYVLQPKYKVNSSVFIGKEISQGVDEEENLYIFSDVNMYRNLMDTYVRLIQSKDMIEDAIKKNNIDISVDEVLRNFEVNNEVGTQIIDVSLTYKDNKVATRAVTAIIDEFSSYAQELIPNVSVKVIESAVEPRAPISPNKSKNILLTGIVGILLSVIAALILFLLDNKIRYKEDLESLLGIPVVGCISEVKKGI